MALLTFLLLLACMVLAMMGRAWVWRWVLLLVVLCLVLLVLHASVADRTNIVL